MKVNSNGSKSAVTTEYSGKAYCVSDTSNQSGNAPDRFDVNQCLEGIKRLFPDASVSIADLDGINDIRNFVQLTSSAFHIIISPDILKKMASDSDFYKECKDRLLSSRKQQKKQLQDLWESGKLVLSAGIILDDKGKMKQWTVSKSQATEPGIMGNSDLVPREHDLSIDRFQGKDKNTILVRNKLAYIPAKDLVRIARARNQRDVKGVMAGIQARINQLKTGKGDKKTVRLLVGQADQVMLKARLKIRLLKKEQLMESCQKQAVLKAELKRALQLKRFLSEHKSRRKSREYGQIRDYYPRPDKNRQDEDGRDKAMDQLSDMSVYQIYQPVGSIIKVSSVNSCGSIEGGSISITI